MNKGTSVKGGPGGGLLRMLHTLAELSQAGDKLDTLVAIEIDQFQSVEQVSFDLLAQKLGIGVKQFLVVAVQVPENIVDKRQGLLGGNTVLPVLDPGFGDNPIPE